MRYLILSLATFIFLPTSLHSQLTVTKVFIVRHADRLAGDDLSPAGILRANELKRLLLFAQIDSVFSTNFNRTKKTVKPLADARGLPVLTYAAEIEVINRIIASSTGKRVLVAAHSDTVDELIRRCGGTPPSSIVPNIPDTQFDNLFEVIITKAVCSGIVTRKVDVIQMKYGAATP